MGKAIARFSSTGGGGGGGALRIAFTGSAGVIGLAYSASLTAAGGSYPYTYSISVGSLPAGLTLNASTGAITGTPTTAASTTFTGEVTDSASATATVSCTIAVTATSTGAAAQPYSITLSEIGPRTIDLSNQSTHTTMQAVVFETISLGSALGTQLHVQYSSDNGSTWGYDQIVASDRVDMDGTSTYWKSTVDVGGAAVWVLPVAVNWKARVWALNSYVDGGPSTAITSSAYSVPAIGSPSATAPVIAITNAAGSAPTQANIYMGTNGPGNPYAMVNISVTTPGYADPNLWYCDGWVRWVNSSGSPISPGGVGNQPGWQPGPQFPNVGTKVWWVSGAAGQGFYINYPAAGVDGYLQIEFFAHSRSMTGNAPPFTGDSDSPLVTTFGSSGVYTLHVGPPPTLAVSYAGTSAAQLTVAYTGSVSASGGTSPYTYAISVGALPAGLSLNASTGAITGTPTAVGSDTFTVVATDSLGVIGSVNANIAVASASSTGTFGLTLVFSGGGAVIGSPYSGSIQALSGTGPFTFSITSGALPAGLSLNTSTGAITGTPTATGSFVFNAHAVDHVSATADLSCQIIVSPYGTLSASFSGAMAQVGVPYSGHVVASGGKPGYTFALTSGALPLAVGGGSLALNSASGAITGTPLFYSTTNFIITVTDALLATAAVSCTITVSASTSPTPTGNITAVTAGISGRTLNPDQSTTAIIQITPSWLASYGQQSISVWLYFRRAIGTSPAWYWQYSMPVLAAGSIYLNALVVPGASVAAQVAVLPGAYAGDSTVALGSLPAGAVMSSAFTMVLNPPSASGLTGARAADANGTTITAAINFVDADGAQDWEIPQVFATLPGNSDPDCWYYSLTFQAYNAAGSIAAPANAGGVEVEVERFTNPPAGGQIDCTAINSYGYQSRVNNGYSYGWLRWYGVNRNAVNGWQDTAGNSVKQTTCWAGADHVVVSFLTPSGSIDLSRVAPSSIGNGLTTDSVADTINAPAAGANMLTNPGFEAGLQKWGNTGGSRQFGTPTLVTISASSFNPLSGSYMLDLGNAICWEGSEFFPCVANQSLTGSCWIRSDGGSVAPFDLFLIFWAADKATAISFPGTAVSAASPGAWVQVSIVGVAPSGASYVTVEPHLPSAGTNSWYVDNVSLIYTPLTGSGTTVDANGNLTLKYGAAVADDGSGNITVLTGGPLYKDVSHDLNLAFDTGAYGSTFAVNAGELTLSALTVTALTAGTATFFGTASFRSASGPQVQIGGAGVVLVDNYSSPQFTMTIASTGFSVSHGSNTVGVTALGVLIGGPSGSGSLSLTSGGMILQNGTSSVTITASSVAILNGTFQTSFNGATTTIANLGGGSYGAIAFQTVDSSGCKAIIYPTAFQINDYTGANVFTVWRANIGGNDRGVLSVTDAVNGNSIVLDPDSGITMTGVGLRLVINGVAVAVP